MKIKSASALQVKKEAHLKENSILDEGRFKQSTYIVREPSEFLNGSIPPSALDIHNFEPEE